MQVIVVYGDPERSWVIRMSAADVSLSGASFEPCNDVFRSIVWPTGSNYCSNEQEAIQQDVKVFTGISNEVLAKWTNRFCSRYKIRIARFLNRKLCQRSVSSPETKSSLGS